MLILMSVFRLASTIMMQTVKIKISMETNKEMCLYFNLTKDNEEWQTEGKWHHWWKGLNLAFKTRELLSSCDISNNNASSWE